MSFMLKKLLKKKPGQGQQLLLHTIQEENGAGSLPAKKRPQIEDLMGIVDVLVSYAKQIFSTHFCNAFFIAARAELLRLC